MKTPGQTMESPFYGMMRELPDQILLTNVECHGDVYVKHAFLNANSWFDEKNPGRPYMHIFGECRSIKGEIPHGISGIHFQEGRGISVDFFYEFSDAEIVKLVKKGLYRPNFKCPDILQNNVLDMPFKCDFKVLAPDDVQGIPIVFADIVDKHRMVTNAELCHYQFADYFEKVEEPAPKENFFDFEEFALDDDLLATSVKAVEPEVVTESSKPLDPAFTEHYENIKRRMESRLEKASKPEDSISKFVESLFDTQDDSQLTTSSEPLSTSSSDHHDVEQNSNEFDAFTALFGDSETESAPTQEVLSENLVPDHTELSDELLVPDDMLDIFGQPLDDDEIETIDLDQQFDIPQSYKAIIHAIQTKDNYALANELVDIDRNSELSILDATMSQKDCIFVMQSLFEDDPLGVYDHIEAILEHDAHARSLLKVLHDYAHDQLSISVPASKSEPLATRQPLDQIEQHYENDMEFDSYSR